MGRIGKLVREERGATAVEYGLILALMVLVMLSGVSALGNSVSSKWKDIGNKVAAATPTSA